MSDLHYQIHQRFTQAGRPGLRSCWYKERGGQQKRVDSKPCRKTAVVDLNQTRKTFSFFSPRCVPPRSVPGGKGVRPGRFPRSFTFSIITHPTNFFPSPCAPSRSIRRGRAYLGVPQLDVLDHHAQNQTRKLEFLFLSLCVPTRSAPGVYRGFRSFTLLIITHRTIFFCHVVSRTALSHAAGARTWTCRPSSPSSGRTWTSEELGVCSQGEEKGIQFHYFSDATACLSVCDQGGVKASSFFVHPSRLTN